MTENKNNRSERNKIEIYVPMYATIAMYLTESYNVRIEKTH
jgi:hypothetical protein